MTEDQLANGADLRGRPQDAPRAKPHDRAARSLTGSEEYAVAPTAEGLVDLLDRVVHRGAVVYGDVIISLAGIDLIRLDLRLLLVSIDGALR
jgi:hypothetical protein